MRPVFLVPGLAFSLALSAAPVTAWGEELSPETIRCQLDPACGTGTPQQENVTRSYRSIDPTGSIAGPKQNVSNLHVSFEYNSAVLQTDARITLDNLGLALSDPSLAGYKFLIGGHTDAKGSATYNQALSKKRALAVRDYLVSHYKIPASKLTAKGYGSVQLLDPEHPLNGINRRVQIVNTTVPGSEK
jgi:outer membrane protein OmpA-like peptidoglycan-associated protein